MKKMLAVLVALLCLLGLPGGAALAEGEVQIGLTVGAVEGEVGSTVSLPVSITDCATVDSLQFNLNYDGSAIRVESVTPGQVFPAEYVVTNLAEPNRVRAACISATGLTAEGVMMTLTCKVLKEGGSAVTLSDVIVTSVDETYNQLKAYVIVSDGAVTTAGAAAPVAVVTPWIAETPEPTPSPVPTPTVEPPPMVVNETLPDATEAPQKSSAPEKDMRKTMATVLIGVIAALLLSAGAIVIISVQNKKRKRNTESGKKPRRPTCGNHRTAEPTTGKDAGHMQKTAGIKKMIILMAVIVAVLALAACGSTGKEAQQAEAAPGEPQIATIDVTPSPVPTPTPTPAPTPTAEPKNRSQTSGRVVPEGTPSRPLIMSIENSDAAKPQTGLMQADIVYEFMVEYMITRFQALFADQYPMYAGPFRSARYYFIDLAQEWDCMYLHLGYGPPSGQYHYKISEIADKVAVYPRDGEKQFYGYSSAFSRKKGAYNDYSVKNGYRFRASDRSAPNNLYVLVDKTAQKYFGDHQAAVHERFSFLEGVSYADGQSFTSVSLPYANSGNPGWIQFTYDPGQNRLYRKENGANFMVRTPSEDGDSFTEEQMNVQNLIVQYVQYGMMPGDDKARRTCELTGTGKCDYFINGQHVTGTWSRPTLEDFTTYSLDDGSTVILEPGNTWIAIHPNDAAATVA